MIPSKMIKEQFQETPCPERIFPAELVQRIRSLLPIAEEYLENTPKNHFHRDEGPAEVNEVFNTDLPENPDSWENIVQFLKEEIISRFLAISSPYFLAYIPSAPSPPAIIGAALTPLFNQFAGNVIASPGGSAIEGLAIKWITQLLNLAPTSWGSFTMGGSGANLTCIYAGLVDKAPWNIKKNGLFNNKRLMIYTSDQSHNCIIKAAMLLGLGEESVRIVPSDDSYHLTPEAVRRAIEEDEQDDNKYPVMIIANAGTTNTGAIDDITGLHELAKEKRLWLHVDGAYGAFARITDAAVSKELEALELADSIALDGHKWLFSPFEAGLAILKESNKLRIAFELGAEYLKDSDLEEDYPLQRNFRSYGFPLTRELRGLKIWMLIRSYGKQGLSHLITRNILVADYLRKRIQEHPSMELMTDGKLSIVCFRWTGSDEFNENIITRMQERKKFYLSRTTLKGKATIRVCILNLDATPELMDELIDEIESIVTEVNHISSDSLEH
ncbi:MAG: pyridoxal phosphate-dependent decarboxylase family protein [Candidatus Odinarchaeota archaeon]